jgi:type 1 glutamine amidotransferase
MPSIQARLILGSALALFACSAQSRPDKLSILIVDGINNHDWETGTRALKTILTATGRFTVDVSTTPPRQAPKEAWDGWRPQFSRYQAVLINFNGGHLDDGVRWPSEVERALESYVRSGGGLIVFHAANNAFLHWPAYNEMIGLGWRNKDFGPGLTITDDGKVTAIPKGSGLNPGHGPRHDFQMRVLDREHPITLGIPDRWMHPSEQLTHGQHGVIDLTILTYAYSKDSKQNEPMDWVRSYGGGRVYTTMLGHTWKNEPNPNLECAGFQTLVARGVEWAASGRVTIPVPAEFPGPDKMLLKPLP